MITNRIDMDKEQIKKVRFSLDLNQKQFAKRLNVSIQTVQSWEQGICEPCERSEFKLKGLI